MPATTTYDDVLTRWCGYCGIQRDRLQNTDAEVFQQYANKNLRFVWEFTDWPEVMGVKSVSVTSNQIDLSADATVQDVLAVYTANPLSDTTAEELVFESLDASVFQLYGNSIPATVYIWYRKPVAEFGSTADTIPYRFAEYVASASFADWLRMEDDTKYPDARNEALALLDREIDKLERQQKQTRGSRVLIYQPRV